MIEGISVIICCYNSASKLPGALKHLAAQVTDDTLNWEVILVNNNSTDDTVEIAKQLWRSLGSKKNLSIISECTPGLSNARNAGVKAALFDIIVFCDDDNLLADNYLQRAYELVCNTAPSGYVIWGGRPIEYFDVDTAIPDWFEKEKENYVVGEQGIVSGDISNRGYVWGAGMVILKALYLKIINQQLPTLLNDRTGVVLSSGGDSEISLRMLIAGYKLYYDENLILKHYISKEKLTKEYNNELISGFRSANLLLNKYKIFIHYISNRNFLHRLYYSCIYSAKYFLSIAGLRSLTDHDTTVLGALFQNRFHDTDFDLMRSILRLRNKT